MALLSVHRIIWCTHQSHYDNNNIKYDNVYGAVIMTEVIVRVHLVQLMNVD